MWQFLTTVVPIIINKEDYMSFLAGLLAGIIIGGLVGVFVTPMFWKPKS